MRPPTKRNLRRHILELTILADAMDPRPDTIGGNITPEWGLHLIDAHIAMGDIVRLAESQTAAYLAP